MISTQLKTYCRCFLSLSSIKFTVSNKVGGKSIFKNQAHGVSTWLSEWEEDWKNLIWIIMMGATKGSEEQRNFRGDLSALIFECLDLSCG